MVDEVAHDDSWERDGGTKWLVRLAMSLIKAWAWAPREPKVEITNVITLMRAPGGASGRGQSSRVDRQPLEHDVGEEETLTSY